MLNYETLLSSYDDKLTLMQWLKKVEAALKDASAVDFKVNKKGDATLTFSIVFEDGSEIESGEIVLQQGESVESAAIVNGHLILTLTNGDTIDAGQLLNGDLNVSGNLAATGKITGAEIIENMTGYTFSPSSNPAVTTHYASVVKNGNKITFVISGIINTPNGFAVGDTLVIGIFGYPTAIGNKLVPNVGTSRIGYKPFRICANHFDGADCNSFFTINSTTGGYFSLGFSQAVNANSNYYFRFEETFLLSDNMAA